MLHTSLQVLDVADGILQFILVCVAVQANLLNYITGILNLKNNVNATVLYENKEKQYLSRTPLPFPLFPSLCAVLNQKCKMRYF